MSATDNGASNSTDPAQGLPKTSPSQFGDRSNVANYKIIESTLREAEQFVTTPFDQETKIKIAKALDSFGVDYIELTNPCSSEQSFQDCKAIAGLGLKAKILTHVRCGLDDAKKAVEAGVNGVNLVIGTSSFSPELSRGESMELIQKTVLEVIEYLKGQNVEIIFSSEESFRSDLVDILSLYKAVDQAGVNRVGIADTDGGSTPRLAGDLVRTLRGAVQCDIECRFRDDTSCSVANAITALEHGATHIDTSVLGIGQNDGITPLGAFAARMIVAAPDYTKSKYNLKEIKQLEELVAEVVKISVPFNNPVTGFSAFTHKAGIHAKAILNNPSTYEVINPADFGLTRYVSINSRITGWNAVRSRAEQLGLNLTDDQAKEVTARIKMQADIRPLKIEETDSILRAYHADLPKA